MIAGQQGIGREVSERLEIEIAREVVVVEQGDGEAAALQAAQEFVLMALVEADIDLGMGRREAPGDGREETRRDGHEAAHVEPPADALAQTPGMLGEFARMGEQAARLGEQGLAGGGQRHPMSMVAEQQAHAEVCLEFGDGGGDRRLGNIQRPRRPGDAAVIGGGDEIAQLPEAVGYQ